jgi:hypothetical protein
MGMVYFLDNDVILKLITYGMLNEALDCLKIDRSNIRVLDSARFVFKKHKKVIENHSLQVRTSAISFVEQHTEIAFQNSDEHILLVGQNGIDIGEAILIAATIRESSSFLISGDKKCLNALASKDLDSIHKKMQGRVICLEQIVYKLIEIQGFVWVMDRILPNLACDATLKAAFGSGSKSQCETVLGTLNGYIQDLQKTSSGILSDL